MGNMDNKPLVRHTIVCVLCFDPTRNAVLLVEQMKPGDGLRWALPGGTWEIDESAEEAAMREVKEETGLDIELIGLYDSRVEVVELDDIRIAVFILTYEARCAGGHLAPQDPDAQVQRAAWVSITELDRLTFSHPTQRDLIKRYVSERGHISRPRPLLEESHP